MLGNRTIARRKNVWAARATNAIFRQIESFGYQQYIELTCRASPCSIVKAAYILCATWCETTNLYPAITPPYNQCRAQTAWERGKTLALNQRKCPTCDGKGHRSRMPVSTFGRRQSRLQQPVSRRHRQCRHDRPLGKAIFSPVLRLRIYCTTPRLSQSDKITPQYVAFGDVIWVTDSRNLNDHTHSPSLGIAAQLLNAPPSVGRHETTRVESQLHASRCQPGG